MHQPVIFLPGIIAPAAIRYGPLVERLASVNVLVRDLAVYDTNEPPADFSVATELDALDRAANAAGFERFHLYGHSGGGAVALGYAAARGDRLTSLAVDEPASDFTPEGNEVYGWPEFDKALTLPPAEAMNAFMRLQVAQDVQLPEPPVGPPPAWMAMRPAGIRAFVPRSASTGSRMRGSPLRSISAVDLELIRAGRRCRNASAFSSRTSRERSSMDSITSTRRIKQSPAGLRWFC